MKTSSETEIRPQADTEAGRAPKATQPRKRPVSETPFGLAPDTQETILERAPLVHIFERAVMDEARRRSGWRAALGLAPRAYAAECGVFQGHSMAACMAIATRLGLPVTIVGLDTFEGLPPPSDTDLEFAPEAAPYRHKTLFTNTSVDWVSGRLRSHQGSCRFELAKGLFADTLPSLKERTYFFVNIDCDLYEPHLECMEYFYPRLRPGGIIFFDDYHSADYPMGRQAIDKFLADKREKLWHLRYGPEEANHTKAFICKE